MRRRSRLLVLAWLAWAVLAFAQAGFARETGVPIRLVAPQAGATLAAGSTAELEWAPGPGLAALPYVEEWEAFLSLDGGATYPLRITPHLDQDLRRVRFRVPSISTPDARILLRFGDERHETVVELPGRFAIAGSPVLESAFTFSGRAASAGEPALPGRAGVVAWVEGSRRGNGLRQVVSEASPGFRERIAPPDIRGDAAVLVSGPVSPQLPGPLPGDRADTAPREDRRTALTRSGTSPPRASDILLLIQRQNE
ncbi:MAG TPA: hypothetical protein VGM86_06235 [Thermoanaerobaculia bacterium]|jgi:hypothetical protein